MPLSPQSSRDKFDITRGWPNGGAVEKELLPDTGVELVSGDLVELKANGKVDKVTLVAGDEKTVFCIIEGNKESDSYSGNYLGKCVGITGDYEVVSTKFAAGAYAPGTNVTVIAGKWALIAAGEPKQGMVTSYDAVNGLLTVLVTA